MLVETRLEKLDYTCLSLFKTYDQTDHLTRVNDRSLHDSRLKTSFSISYIHISYLNRNNVDANATDRVHKEYKEK